MGLRIDQNDPNKFLQDLEPTNLDPVPLPPKTSPQTQAAAPAQAEAAPIAEPQAEVTDDLDQFELPSDEELGLTAAEPIEDDLAGFELPSDEELGINTDGFELPSDVELGLTDEISGVDAAGIGFLTGATFDFADEVSGKFAQLADWAFGVSEQNRLLEEQGFKGDIGPTTGQEVYEEARDEFRGKSKQAFEQHPVAAIGGTILGGLTLPLAAGAKAASMGGKVAIAAIAAEGAITGAGISEADLAKGEYAQLAKDVAIGTGLGLGGAAVLGVAAKGIRKLAGARKATSAVEKKMVTELDSAAHKSLKDNAEMNKVVGDWVVNEDNYIRSVRSRNVQDFLESETMGKVKLNKQMERRLKEITDHMEVSDAKVAGPKLLDELPSAIPGEVKATTSEALESVNPTFKLYRELQDQGMDIEANQVATYMQLEQERVAYHSFLKNQTGESLSGAVDYNSRALNRLKDPRVDSVRTERLLRKQGRITDESYQKFKYFQAMQKEMGEKLKKTPLGLNDSTGMKFWSGYQDLRYVVEGVDETIGSSIGEFADDLQVAVMQHQGFIVKQHELMKPLVKAGSKVGLDAASVGKAVAGDIDVKTLTKPQQAYVAKWQSVHEDLVDTAKQLGIKVDYRQNYLKQQSLRGADLVRAVRGKVGKVLGGEVVEEDAQAAFNYTTGTFSKAKMAKAKLTPTQVEIAELRAGVEQLTGEPIKTYSDLVAVSKRIQQDTSYVVELNKRALSHDATAAFARKGEIPDYVREFDIEKLFDSYVINLSKAGHLAMPMKYIEGHIPVLRQAGMDKAADYLATYLGHMSGGPTKIMGYKQAATMRYQLGIDEIFKNTKSWPSKKAKEMAQAAPEVVSLMIGQVYPNLLGLNLRFPLRNRTQAFTMHAADMTSGSINPAREAYAYKHAAKATASLAKKQLKGGFGASGKMLKEAGMPQVPAHKRDFAALEEGVRKGWIGKASGALDKWNNMAMWLYSQSDLDNRAVSLMMADSFSDDLFKGVTHATEIANGLPRSIKRTIARGDEKEIRRRLRTYYINKNQLVYGKSAMNEFGRDWGIFASMFSKWPSSVVSDMASIVDRNSLSAAAAKLTTKYFAPWVAMGAVSGVLIDEKSPRSQELFGKRGLAAWAPVNSAKGVLDFGQSPIIGSVKKGLEAGIETGEAALKGKLKVGKMNNFIKESVQMYVPGGNAFKVYEHGRKIVTDKK